VSSNLPKKTKKKSRISALASKKRSNQKSSVRESKYKVPSLILETRAEILEKVLLVFWEI
jgi:hypothetical protein